MLTEIWEQHCLVPDVAKKAAKALKKIGHPVEVGDAGIRSTAACPTFRAQRRSRSSAR